MPSPKVSICMPTYNQPDYFRHVLDSIARQDFKDYELIVSDDSTNDESSKIAEEYKKKIPNLTYIHNVPSKKSPGSWNEAIKHAKGKYIKVQHSDDWFSSPQALGKFVAMLDRHPESDFAFSAANVVGPDKKLKFVHRCSANELAKLRRSPTYLFGRNIVGAPSATIYRASVVHKFYDANMKWVVDLDQYISILNDNPRFEYSDEPLVETTDGAAHQSIHESVGLAKVELYEWLLLYTKIRTSGRPMPYRRFMDLYVFFIMYRCRITSMQQLEGIAIAPEEKRLVERLLHWRHFYIVFKLRRYLRVLASRFA